MVFFGSIKSMGRVASYLRVNFFFVDDVMVVVVIAGFCYRGDGDSYWRV